MNTVNPIVRQSTSRAHLKLRRRAFPLWLTAALLFASVALVSSSAHAEVRLTGPLSYDAVLYSGDVFEAALQVDNTGAEQGAVRVYQTDYLFDAEGRSYFEDPGAVARSNADWIEVPLGVLDIEPQSSRPIPFTVQVPDDPDLVGTYWSVIMVELLTPSDEGGDPGDPGAQQEVQLGFQQVWRYAVQVVTQIGDTGEARLRFENPQVSRADDGIVMLQVDLVNEGERWLNPDVWAELYRSDGQVLARVEGQRQRLYPGTSVRQRLPLAVSEPGVYPVLVLVDNGDEHVFGANYRINIEAP